MRRAWARSAGRPVAGVGARSLRLVLVLGLSGFISSFTIRLVDPIVPVIARDVGVSLAAGALLATGFSFTYAASQPVLGPLGDALGKARVMKASLAFLIVTLLACAFAPDYPTLFAARMMAGLAAGGIIPLAIAMLGDRFAIAERPIALSRFVTIVLMGQMSGAVLSGFLAERVGWRGVFLVAAAFSMLAFAGTMLLLKPRAGAERQPFGFASSLARYRSVFSNPNAVVCFGAVFGEAVAIYGLFPHIAGILEMQGAGGATEAGLVIAASGIGGVVYSAVVPVLLRRLGISGLMRTGGLLASAGLLIAGLHLALPIGAAAFFVLGLGFFMLHNALQTTATELAPEARGSAVSMHAFAFFIGQAVGPALMTLLLPALGVEATFAASAVAMGLIGFAAARLVTRNAARRKNAG